MRYLAFFCLLFSLSAAAQDRNTLLPGYWRGAVSRDGAVQTIEAYFSKKNDSIQAVYHLPDLGLYEEPALLQWSNDSFFTIKTFMGVFNCVLNKEHAEVTGDNKNWKPVGLKLHIKKMTAPPAGYIKQDLGIRSGDVVLKGTLFKPVHQKTFPVVVIAHGAQDPTRNNWVYRYYAYLLVQHGYSVYIFDQRGSGQTGGSKEATLKDLAKDIIAIGSYFKKQPYATRLAVIGESRGGWVAEVAATSAPFSTIILVQGPAKGPIELEYDVVASSLKQDRFAQAQIDSALQYTRLYFKTVRDSSSYPQLAKQYYLIKDRPWARVLQDTEAANDAGLLWWKGNDFEPSQYLTKTKASVLAIFGGADVLVPPSANEALMKKYLAASQKKHKVVTIANLPHGLYFYQTLYGNEFSWPQHYWIWPKRSVEMDEISLQWLKEELK